MALSPRWVLPVADPEAVDCLAALGVGALACRTLAHRGFRDAAAARLFLDASIHSLHDPLQMRDMAPAAERLHRAIRNREKILIYGDYDVDGTISVAILVKAIELAGGASAWHIPNRLKDGYGMRPEAVEKAAAEGVSLIVSVDTGIRSADVVRCAMELGIDVIVTDHHLPESELPPALAVLNPNRPDCAYPEKNLCGAGVAFKLTQALFAHMGWAAERCERVAQSFLKMVALATVADVVPLTGENRIFVKHGLNGLRDVRNPGLRALLDVAGFTAAAPDARQVAFQIAPRINAAGRMDTAQIVIELFLTPDAARARELARQLHERNAERQQVEAGILDACLRVPVEQAACALVYYGESWHRGVLGIVASRLVERTRRPVFVLGRNPADGLAQGSGRAIPGFHLLEALESMSDLFKRFGGHKYATGATLDAQRIDEFRARFNARAAQVLCADDFIPRLEIDAVVDLAEIDEEAIRGVFALSPFGHGNPPPLFAAMGVEVAAPPVVMKEKHLRVTVRKNHRTMVLKAWNFAGRSGELTQGDTVDVAFALEEDAYSAARGYPGWCAVLKDVRPGAKADPQGFHG